MSPQIDDKALDEYLEGGSLMSQRYRELGAEEVPDALNRQVLDRARAAVEKRSARPRTWVRWSAPLALAATLTLVVSIVIDSGVQQGMEPVPARPAEQPVAQTAASADALMDERESASVPAAAPAEAASLVAQQEQVEPPPPASPEAAAQRKAASRRALESKSKSENALAAEAQRERALAYEPAPASEAGAIAPPSAPAAASAQQQFAGTQTVARQNAFPAPAPARQLVRTDTYALQEAIVTGKQRAEEARDARTMPVHVETSAQVDVNAEADADDLKAVPRAYLDPELWLEDIRKLRQDGDTQRADREWERFRAAFPDHRVADDDVARASASPSKK